MTITYDLRESLEVVTIFPGEHHATRERRTIATTLGSCVSVVLHDVHTHITGINHFMLPGTFGTTPFYLTDAGRYGMYAIELLINEILRIGGRRDAFRAKVFGGATSPLWSQRASESVGAENVRFAMAYLEAESIPLIASDVGGSSARRIAVSTTDGSVRLWRRSVAAASVGVREQEYRHRITSATQKRGHRSATLFGERGGTDETRQGDYT